LSCSIRTRDLQFYRVEEQRLELREFQCKKENLRGERNRGKEKEDSKEESIESRLHTELGMSEMRAIEGYGEQVPRKRLSQRTVRGTIPRAPSRQSAETSTLMAEEKAKGPALDIGAKLE
jgi:hypothetical protein